MKLKHTILKYFTTIKKKKKLYIDFPPVFNGRENLKRQVGVKNIERSQQSQLSVPTCNSAVFSVVSLLKGLQAQVVW